MLQRLRLPPERSPSATRVQQESFCGSCQGQARFMGTQTTLAINYLQSYFQLIACGLEGATAQQNACRSRPWQKIAARRASAGVERFLAAVNLVLLGSWLRFRKAQGDRGAVLGLWTLRSGLRQAEAELRGVELDPARFQEVAQSDPLGTLPEVFSAIMARLAGLCGRPELTQPMSLAGRSLAHSLVLWHLSLPPSPNNPDWFSEWRQELAKDPEGLRHKLTAHLTELRGHLVALPLGESREAVLEVVAAMAAGDHSEQRPGSSWLEAIKRRWLQSGDTC